MIPSTLSYPKGVRPTTKGPHQEIPAEIEFAGGWALLAEGEGMLANTYPGLLTLDADTGCWVLDAEGHRYGLVWNRAFTQGVPELMAKAGKQGKLQITLSGLVKNGPLPSNEAAVLPHCGSFDNYVLGAGEAIEGRFTPLGG